MAIETVVKMPTGQLRVSRIVYFTDLIHTDTRELPVGVVAEITLPLLRGIGTALRTDFSADELAMMGPTARGILSNAMDGLWPAMKAAFEQSGPGCALDLLTASYSSSISVLAPFTLDVPRQFLLKRDAPALKTMVRNRMLVTLTDEYFRLLFPPREGDIPDPAVEEEIAEAEAA